MKADICATKTEICAMKMTVGLALAIAVFIPEPCPAAAQGTTGVAADELALDREVFVYPGDSRRDPFQPLLPADSAGPRFEELRMIGVVLSPDPRQSVALLAETAAPPTRTMGMTGRTFRVREESVLGHMRVLAIEHDLVVVEFERFGTREVGQLELHRRSEGDGP